MINEVGMFLASYGYYGGAVGSALNRLEQMGFFAYVLPFLLIFALVFGILSTVKIFKENRAIDAVIALVVGLMALQLEIVPEFFAQVFPRMGIALAAILTILILAGLFLDERNKETFMKVLMVFGVIAAIIVLISASDNTGFYYSFFNTYWFYNWGPIILIIGFSLIVLGAIVAGAKKASGSSGTP